MAKFCMNCGAEKEDENLLCPACTNSQQPTTEVSPEQEQQAILEGQNVVNEQFADGSSTVTVAKRKKQFYIVMGVAVLAIIMIIALIFGGSGYMGPIKKMCKGIESGNAKYLLSTIPKEVVKADSIEKDDLQLSMDGLKETLEDQYGKNIKVTYKKLQAKKMDKDDLTDLKDDLKEYYNVNGVSEAYNIKVSMEIKGNEDSDVNVTDVVVMKIKGKWYLDPSNSGDLF